MERLFAQGLNLRNNEAARGPHEAVVASLNGDVHAGFYFGETSLTAVLRCFVAWKLGPTVEIPEHLW